MADVILEDDFDDFSSELEERLRHPSDKNKSYDNDTITIIQIIYIFAAILWIIFIFVMDFYAEKDPVVWMILLIPLLVFAVGFTSACTITVETENEFLGANHLSFAFLVSIIIINWNFPLKASKKSKFFKILILAFILIMLSMIDIWVSRKNLSIVKHIKSAFQTSALVILALSLYIYYKGQKEIEENHEEENHKEDLCDTLVKTLNGLMKK